MTKFVRDIYNRTYNLKYLRRGGWVKTQNEHLWVGYFGKRGHEAKFDHDPTQEAERVIIPGTGVALAYHLDISRDKSNSVWSSSSEIIAWSIIPGDPASAMPICIDGLQEVSCLIFVVRNGKKWEELDVATYTDSQLLEEARKRGDKEWDEHNTAIKSA